MTEGPYAGVRVFLADDHPAVREGLTLRLLQECFVVCGEAENRAELVAKIDGSGADIALVDLSLCEESGLDLIPDLRSRGIPVVVYSMHEDADTVYWALARGAASYVTKRESSAVLVEAVRRTLAGERYISPRIAAVIDCAQAQDKTLERVALSERERQTLELLGRGETNADIAAALGVSVRTVESYYARIQVKLGLNGMKALRKFVISSQRPR